MLNAGRKRTRRETIRAAMDAARSEGKPTLVTRRHADGVYRWWWCEDFNNGHLNTWLDMCMDRAGRRGQVDVLRPGLIAQCDSARATDPKISGPAPENVG